MLALVATVGLIMVYVIAGTARPRLNGTVSTAGIENNIEIARDSLGVPHIWAASEHDLLFAQGWAHAQDRLWQMELFRRIAEGRLAEALGEALVESDRFLRTIGLWRAAGEQLARLAPERLRALEAYAAGVNASLAQRRGALPPELLVLRIQPEPWTPQHVLAIERLMAWDLSAWGISRATSEAARLLGVDRAAKLVPAYPADGPTIIPLPIVPELPPAAAALLDAASFTRASNAWVIAGSRTRSGRPILANDMHLPLRAPSLWYLVALHAPALDVAGMSIPGVPYVIAGHNRAIAWGYTNASLDDLDFFVERIDPADSTRYLTPAGSEPFQLIHDTIRVKNGDPVPIVIRLTRHGPVLPSMSDPNAGGPLAMRWAGNDSSATIEAVPALNRAANWNQFRDAVRLFNNPHQNVVYADTAGNIGYIMGGRIPVRGEGKTPPVLPVPGWTGEWDWNGWLPFDEHPQAFNPSDAFVVTANNRQAPSPQADRITTYWEQPYRAARIRQMILEAEMLDDAAVHAMQLDLRDALAERYRALATEAARRAGLEEGVQTLERWDLRAARDSRGAALFYAWYESLNRLVRAELYGDTAGPLSRSAVDAMLDRNALPWGDTTHARFDAITSLAMHAADSIAGEHTWGQLHQVVAEHQLGSVALLERLLRLNIGPLPGDGSPTTVNVSDYEPRQIPVNAAYGPSQRHVVDMADVDHSGGFILPTGQSGVPVSRDYRSQARRWRDGGLWRIPLSRGNAEARFVHRLYLRPVRPAS
jgi:penicillin amidase